MDIINNKMFSTSLKYIYLTLCLICFYGRFFETIETIDTLLTSLESYLPLIGIILVLLVNKTNYKINNNILFIVLMIYFFAVAIGNLMVINEYVLLAILAILFSNENPKPLFQYILVLNLIILFTNLSLSHYNIFPYNTFKRGENIRHAFNYLHPNSIGTYCLSTYCLICYVLRRYKITILVSGILLFRFTFFYVDSRTSGLLIILLLAIHFIYWISHFIFSLICKLLKYKPKFVKYIFLSIIIIIPISCFLFTIYSSFAYSPDNLILDKLNTILSTRISLQHNALVNDGLPLLGIQKEFLTTSTYDLIDNLYSLIIYRYGLIFELCLIGFITYFLFKRAKNSSVFSVFWLTLIWSLFSLSEPFAIYFSFNPFLLLLFNNYQKDKELEVAYD